MTSRSASLRALLGRPVMLEGIRLGTPSDAVLDKASLRVVGLEVVCGDGFRRFLPLAAARVRADHLAVGSALVLLEEGDRAFYRRRSRSFRELLGGAVTREGHRLGELVDLVVGRDGLVEAVAVRTGLTGVRLHEGAGLTIEPAKASAA